MDARSLLLLAQAISAQYNVNVVFADVGTASCAYSDDKYTIVLPFSDASNAEALYRGYIDHEVGHVRFTDFEEIGKHSNELRDLANIFEDEFVERRMGALFPGAKINLRNLARTIFTEEHVKDALQRGAMSKLFAFMLYHRRAMLDPQLGQWNAMIDDSVRDLGVPEDVLAQMQSVVEAPSNSTAENFALAEKLYALFQPYKDDTEPMDGGAFDVLRNTFEALDGKAMEELSDFEKELAEACELVNDSKFRPFGEDELFAVALDEKLVSSLCRRIPALLQSSRIKPCVPSSRGRLHNKRLARVATLDTRVFLAPARKVDDAIEIGFLADYSGSMWEDCKTLDKAVYASLVMLKSLPHVKSFVYGFNSYVFKCLCSKDSVRARGFRGMKARGSTPLGASMLSIAAQFDRTGRRILLVTTDGHPDNTLCSTREVCERVARMGIELYGIGLGKDAQYLQDLFGEERTVVIDDIAEYPERLEAMLCKALLCAN